MTGLYPLNKYLIASNPGPVLFYDGSGWVDTVGSAGRNLRGVWGSAWSDLFAIGDNGTILHNTGEAQTGSLNRLLQEHRKNAAGDTIYKIEYTFDDNSSKNGNIHRVVYDGKHITEFQYNEMNELTGITHPDNSTETLTYDNNGNLIQTTNNNTGEPATNETTAYQWDCFDRMTKVTMPPKYGAEAVEEISFTYNGEDELIKITYPDLTIDMKESKGDFVRKTAKFRFNGQQTPSDVEMSSFDIYIMGQLLCKYSSGPDAASTSRNSGRNTGESRFYHYDHNGNMALVTDEFGNITNKILMDAYGNVLPLETISSSKPTQSHSESLLTGSMGIIFLNRIKIYQMKRRFFAGNNYKFLSPDPLSMDNMDYLFVDNNPINYYDPTGLFKMKAPNTKGGFPDNVYYDQSRKISLYGLFRYYVIPKVERALLTEACKKAFCNCCTYKNIDWKKVLKRMLTYSIQFVWTKDEITSKEWSFQKVAANPMRQLPSSHYTMMLFNYSYLGSSINDLAFVMIHELAHDLKGCNIDANWAVKHHGCADVIAAKCLNLKHIPQLGDYYDVKEKRIITQLRKLTLGSTHKIPSLNDYISFYDPELSKIKRKWKQGEFIDKIYELSKKGILTSWSKRTEHRDLEEGYNWCHKHQR